MNMIILKDDKKILLVLPMGNQELREEEAGVRMHWTAGAQTAFPGKSTATDTIPDSGLQKG